MKSIVRPVMFFLLIHVFLLPVQALAEGRLVFGWPERSYFGGKAQKLLRQAYGKIGYSVEFKRVPMLRSLDEVNSGHFDGEVCRLRGLSSQYPNLILVRVPLCIVHVVAVSRTEHLLKGWDDFAGLAVAYRPGIVGVRHLLPTNVRIMGGLNTKHALDLVVENRVDVALLLQANIKSWLNTPQYAKLCVQELPFGRMPLYHYLHERHATLVPKVEVVLRGLVDH